MNTESVTLYVDSNFTSPYAMAVFVTLAEKNIPFEVKKIDLETKENYDVEYSTLSRTCRVPTLSIGDFNLSESSAITEYLEEIYPPPQFVPVYPNDIKEKAIARQIQAWIRSDFLEIRIERSTEVIFYSKQNSSPLSEAATKSLNKLLSALENILLDDRVNIFSQWCIADTELALMLNRLIMNGDSIPEKLQTYADYQWQKKSVQKWVNLSQT